MHYKRKLVCTVLVYQRLMGRDTNSTSCTRLKIPAPETIVCPDHPRIDVIYDAIGGCAVTDVLEGKSMYIEFVYLYICMFNGSGKLMFWRIYGLPSGGPRNN